MNKRSVRIVAIILFAAITLLFAASMSGCDLFGGSGTNNKEDDKGNTIKPNISQAQTKYEEKEKKRSDATVTVSGEIFSKKTENSPVSTMGMTEKLLLRRINDGQRFFADAEATTTEADDSLVNLYKMYRMFEDDYEPDDDKILQYLEKESSLTLKIGYESCYNLTVGYKSAESEATKSFCFGDDIFENVAEGALSGFVPASYFMSGGILDFKKTADWLAEDKANRFFSTDRNKFIYQLQVDENKVKSGIVEKINRYASLLVDENEIISEEDYAKIAAKAERWIKINPTEVNALVSYDGLPDKTDYTLSVDININLAELEDVLFILLGKDKKDEAMGLINSVVAAKNLCGTDGQKGTLGIRFAVTREEKFSYAAKDCTVEQYDEMFLPIDEEREGRTKIEAEDIRKAVAKIIDRVFGTAEDSAAEQ